MNKKATEIKKRVLEHNQENLNNPIAMEMLKEKYVRKCKKHNHSYDLETLIEEIKNCENEKYWLNWDKKEHIGTLVTWSIPTGDQYNDNFNPRSKK